MNIGNRKRRGRPIYVTTRGTGTTISLVPEIASRQWRVDIGRGRSISMRLLQPFAVYAIDAEGVRRLSFRDRQVWFRVLMLATALLAPMPLRLLARKRRPNNG